MRKAVVRTTNTPTLPGISLRNVKLDSGDPKNIKMSESIDEIKHAFVNRSQKTSPSVLNLSGLNGSDGLTTLRSSAHLPRPSKTIKSATPATSANASVRPPHKLITPQKRSPATSDSIDSSRCQSGPLKNVSSLSRPNGSALVEQSRRTDESADAAATGVHETDRSPVGGGFMLTPKPPSSLPHSRENQYNRPRVEVNGTMRDSSIARRVSNRDLSQMRASRGHEAGAPQPTSGARHPTAVKTHGGGAANIQASHKKSCSKVSHTSDYDPSASLSERARYHVNLVNRLFDRYPCRTSEASASASTRSSRSLVDAKSHTAEPGNRDPRASLEPKERDICDTLLRLRHSDMAPLFIQHPEIAFSNRACLLVTPELVEEASIGAYHAHGVLSTGTVGRSYVVSNAATASIAQTRPSPPRQRLDASLDSPAQWSTALSTTHALASKMDTSMSKMGDGHKYAAKVVSFALRQGLFDEVLAEQSLLVNIHYENVLKVSDLLIDDAGTHIAILTSLQSEGNITRYLGKLEDDPVRLRLILYSIGVAVRMLHSHQIYHHNIKPENVLQTSSGGYCLADAGLDKLFTAQSPEALVFNGELACMPPELFDPEGLYAREWATSPGAGATTMESRRPLTSNPLGVRMSTNQEEAKTTKGGGGGVRPMTSRHTLAVPRPRAASIQSAPLHDALTAVDVWGLGVLAYRLAYGTNPIHITNKSVDEVRRTICAGEELSFPATPSSSSRFHDDLQSLIRRCLDTKPSQRPSVTEFLTHAFFDDVDLFKRVNCDAALAHPSRCLGHPSHRVVSRLSHSSFWTIAPDVLNIDTPITPFFNSPSRCASHPMNTNTNTGNNNSNNNTVINWEADYACDIVAQNDLVTRELAIGDFTFHDGEANLLFEKCRQCGYVPEFIIDSGRFSQTVVVRLRQNMNELFAFHFMKESILKRLNAALSPTDLYSVRRQLAISRKLNHPNVLSYMDIVDDSNGLCFVLHPYTEYSCITSVPQYVHTETHDVEKNSDTAPTVVAVHAGRRKNNNSNSNMSNHTTCAVPRPRRRMSLSLTSSTDNSSLAMVDTPVLSFSPKADDAAANKTDVDDDDATAEGRELAEDASMVRSLNSTKAELQLSLLQSPAQRLPPTQLSPLSSEAKDVWEETSRPCTASASPLISATAGRAREQTAEPALRPRSCRRGRTASRSDRPETSGLLQSFLRDILHGLAHLHDHGIAHLHLIPSSIVKSNMGKGYKIGSYGASFVLVEELVQSLQTSTPIYSLPDWLREDLPQHPFHLDTFLVGLLAASSLPSLHHKLWSSVCARDGSPPFCLEQTLQTVRAAPELPASLVQFIEESLTAGTTARALLRHPFLALTDADGEAAAQTHASSTESHLCEGVAVTEADIAAAIQCRPETCDEMRFRNVLGTTAQQEMDLVPVPSLEQMMMNAHPLESSLLGMPVDDVVTGEEAVSALAANAGAAGGSQLPRAAASRQSGSIVAPLQALGGGVTPRYSTEHGSLGPGAGLITSSRCCSAGASSQVIMHEYTGPNLKCVQCGAEILAVVFYCMTCANCVRCGKCAVDRVDAEGHALVPLILHSITHERSGASLAKMFHVSHVQYVHVLEELEMRENLPVGSLSTYLTTKRSVVRNSVTELHSHRTPYYDYALDTNNVNDVSVNSPSSMEQSVRGSGVRHLGHVLPGDYTSMASISLSMSTDSNYAADSTPCTAHPLLSKGKSKLFHTKGRLSGSGYGNGTHSSSQLSMSHDVSADAVNLGSPALPMLLKRSSGLGGGGNNSKLKLAGKGKLMGLKQTKRQALPKAEEFNDSTWQQEIDRCCQGELSELLLYNLRFTEVPCEVYSPPPLHVVHLDLSQNEIDTLPHELSFLIHLRRLIVSYNKLVALPDSLGNLRELEFLDASHNTLTDLPQSFVYLSSLERIALDYNNFVVIPESLLSILPAPCAASESMMGSLSESCAHLLAQRHRAPSSTSVCPAEAAGAPNSASASGSVAALPPRLGAIYLAANDRLCTFPTLERLRRFRSLKIALDNEPSLYRYCSALNLDVELPNVTISWNKIYPDEIAPLLFCGSLRSAQSQMVYKKLNISYVLTMGRDLVPVPPEGGTHRVIMVDDIPGADIMSSFQEACDFIEESQTRGAGCLVHCFAGISRSATTVIAYLMMNKKMRLDEAYLMAKKGRPAILPNKSFFEQLIQLDKQLFPKDPRPLNLDSLGRPSE